MRLLLLLSQTDYFMKQKQVPDCYLILSNLLDYEEFLTIFTRRILKEIDNIKQEISNFERSIDELNTVLQALYEQEKLAYKYLFNNFGLE